MPKKFQKKDTDAGIKKGFFPKIISPTMHFDEKQSAWSKNFVSSNLKKK